MDNLQLATTLVAPTGTGLLYIAYDQRGDLATWKVGSGASRSIVSLKRVQAKPTSTFPGVERFELKRTNYITVDSVEYTCVATLTTSIPVVVGLSDRTAIHVHAALLAQDSIFSDAIETGVIPT
jgi:selenocysteine lyase/cysteine desulfurase